jgi:tripartite-type tricarboxylate transporter receptor subunit TctC
VKEIAVPYVPPARETLKIAAAPVEKRKPRRVFPGGAVNLISRLIEQSLSERLGQSFIVENHPGVGNNLAPEEVVHASPEGYTLLEFGSSNAWNMSPYENLKIRFHLRYCASHKHLSRYRVLVVRPSFTTTTLPEFIAYAKANPGKLRMASRGSAARNTGARAELCCRTAI